MKIDLKDVTFLIPIRIESEDRQQNLNTVLNHLFSNYETTVFLLEADTESKVRIEKDYPNLEYVFVHDTDEIFHRTKYLNQMTRKAKTRFISIYDVDIVLPRENAIETMNVLRKGEYKVVYPFTVLRNIPNTVKNILMKMEITSIFLQKINSYCRSLYGTNMFGAVVFFSRKEYVEAGMENERFYGWGHEDHERMRRMLILGYSHYRVDKPIYHLDHSRGVNSKYENADHRQRTNMKELIEVCKMKKDELKEYITTW